MQNEKMKLLQDVLETIYADACYFRSEKKRLEKEVADLEQANSELSQKLDQLEEKLNVLLGTFVSLDSELRDGDLLEKKFKKALSISDKVKAQVGTNINIQEKNKENTKDPKQSEGSVDSGVEAGSGSTGAGQENGENVGSGGTVPAHKPTRRG